MTVKQLLVAVLLLSLAACSSGPVHSAPMPLTPNARIAVAVDSLNAAIRDLYAEGGRLESVQLLYPDAYPPDTTLAPSVVVIVRPSP